MADLVYINHLPAIIKALRHVTGEAVGKTAEAIAEDYEKGAPRATGFMASTAYVVTHDHDTYGAHTSGSGPMLPPVDKPEDDQTAIAAVAATYAAYPEYGTRYASAQPAFHPAVDRGAKVLSDLLSDLEA